MADISNALTAYVQGHYRKVSGWLASDTITHILKLDETQRELGITGHVGEIGVHHGKLFILLYLLARTDEKAVAIDLFEAQHLNVDKSGQGDLGIFSKNLETYAGETSKLKLISGDSTTLGAGDVMAAAGGPLRLFSIDGGHTRDIVRHDLTTAAGALREGGIVILDDYFNPEFPGVSEGANRYFLSDNGQAGLKLVPFLIGSNKVYLTTGNHAERYMDAVCRSDLGRPFRDLVKFRAYAADTTTVFVTELWGATVLAYSPDRFGRAYKLRRSLKRSATGLRKKLGETGAWRLLKSSKLGDALRSLANRLAPY
jgi:hypothetical protein